MKRWLPLILFAVLVGFFAKGLFLNPREVPSPFIGKPAPAFTLPLVGNANASFSPADMKGKVWLLNVWAPWCVSCREEHPVLMALARSQSVPIVGLNWKDKGREAEQLLAQTGDPFLAVPDDLSGKVGIDYGVTGTPETYVIDKAGIIRMKHIGAISEEVWKEKIEPKLQELGA
ncbi:MAG: DsbE family thiol:disulfide interchange protein [Hydrogenophilales bacterium CG17_big_fil_post_rev_8_21_14_2_50_63_12]|nr:MAG: DsbE family thiol:disulfide interchange protein [Hydrogenophilales bacterium CG17_big_fil_post_rev_8_21_14_2_50_63_12]PIX98282.1 MAG: DsbE family thiol:disulfide interchange protein [Hydrogenophilales bacterium CG_4_10_14_3_um_filter_63_21]PJB03319.1 MAG: DsbE family thiol:disulfide interchange protein [Hydrogenophilales bacterium CG_4_9_14_3_um_filter_63_34]